MTPNRNLSPLDVATPEEHITYVNTTTTPAPRAKGERAMTVQKTGTFRGREWESSITGQQYATKRAALAAEAAYADGQALLEGAIAAYRASVERYEAIQSGAEIITANDHTVGGKTSTEGWAYGTTHDMACPACLASGSSYTSSPRSETYWAS